MRHLALASILLAASPALAETFCGTAPAAWNLPKGAVALTIGDGPVRAVIQGVGETRTHTMLNHGNGWVTHAAMKQPDTKTSCQNPLDPSQLQNGFPGAQQITMGAAYAYLQNSTVYYQEGKAGGVDKGGPIADYAWASVPYTWDSRGFYRLINNSGRTFNYSLYQFRDVQGSGSGYDSWNDGIVCSSLVSYLQAKAGYGAVSNYTYSHTRLAAGINALYSAVENDCNNSMGFWKSLGAGFVCAFSDLDFNGPCNDAATQVTDCMAGGLCNDGNNDSFYKGIRDNSATVSNAISPDRVGGWSGHSTTATVWGYDYSHTVQWNSGGSVYSCWD